MKKIAPIAVMAVLALGFTSCKKDYTCTCTDKAGKTTAYPYGKTKKSAAKASCDGLNTIAASGGGKCEL